MKNIFHRLPNYFLRGKFAYYFLWLLFMMALAYVPTKYLIKQHKARTDLTQLLFFGKNFQERALPEVSVLNPAVDSEYGYDGQFYAQIALDPLLLQPKTAHALDGAFFRAERILLPVLAYVLGASRPSAVLFAFAILNFLFWVALLIALVIYVKELAVRECLSIAAIVLSAGTLISIQRSLTDLPAMTLGFIGLSLGEISSGIFIALSILTKPTSLVFVLRYVPMVFSETRNFLKIALGLVVALFPPILWYLYLVHAIHGQFQTEGNFDIPFVGWWNHFGASFQTLKATPFLFHWKDVTQWEFNLFEILAMVSLTFQAGFLLLHPRPLDSIWLIGIAFAVLYFTLSGKVLCEQIGYTRSVLPLTLSFNLLLLKVDRRAVYFTCFILGNVGLLMPLHDMVGFILQE